MNNPFQEIADRLQSIESYLADLKQSAIYPPPNAEAELLDVPQAAKFLRLSIQTVYDKVHNDTLPYVKQGNRLYFFKDELILWLKSGRHKTPEELQEVTKEALQASLSTRRRKGGRTSA